MKLILKKYAGVTVLPNSASIQKLIAKVLDTSSRKVAVVAFVGLDAETYLGKDLRRTAIYCWPKAGGTNPYAIQDLLNKYECKVYFVDKLHMKIFWSQDRGCVIGSANLTNNALGQDGLKEAGVYFPNSSSVDIDKIIGAINARPATAAEIARLISAHKKYYSKNMIVTGHAAKKRTFFDWCASRPRETWKLGWYQDEIEFSKIANEIARKEYSLSEPYEFMRGKKGNFEQDDWILMYKVTKKGKILPGSIGWLYAERMINTKEDKVWPYEVIQFRPTKNYSTPPFSIDAKFRKAFKSAGESIGVEYMKPDASCVPPEILIKKIEKYL